MVRVALIKSASLIFVLLVAGCAFAVPEENPITHISVEEFNFRANSPIGFSEKFPNPVDEDHPLYRAVAIGNIEDVPEVIRNINIAIASSSHFEEALYLYLKNSLLLNNKPDSASYFLDVKYLEKSTFGQAVEIHYLLRKKGEPVPLLDRKIKSEVIVNSIGGFQTWQHLRTAAHLAHTLNLASITWCLEQYDSAAFPQVCDLEFSYLYK